MMTSDLLPDTRPPILIPVDFSAASKAAVLAASALVDCLRVPLLLVHVVHEDPESTGFYRAHDRARTPRSLADVATDLMDQFVGELCLENRDIPALRGMATRIVSGLPSKRIVELAEQENAMMIVMASRGRTGLPHWLFGSVAEQVSRHSTRPVTIIKDLVPNGDYRGAFRSLLGSVAAPEVAAAMES